MMAALAAPLEAVADAILAGSPLIAAGAGAVVAFAMVAVWHAARPARYIGRRRA